MPFFLFVFKPNRRRKGALMIIYRGLLGNLGENMWISLTLPVPYRSYLVVNPGTAMTVVAIHAAVYC